MFSGKSRNNNAFSRSHWRSFKKYDFYNVWSISTRNRARRKHNMREGHVSMLLTAILFTLRFHGFILFAVLRQTLWFTPPVWAPPGNTGTFSRKNLRALALLNKELHEHSEGSETNRGGIIRGSLKGAAHIIKALSPHPEPGAQAWGTGKAKLS